MGHDIHFLERITERANSEHQAMALALYRDPQLIRHITQHFFRIRRREERVALALDDGGKGPHVIVTKQGKFVTCLGEGMEVGDTPVIERAVWVACEAWRQQPPLDSEATRQTLEQMLRVLYARSPSRAEVELVEAVGGLYAIDFLKWVTSDLTLLSELEGSMRPRRTSKNKKNAEILQQLKRGWRQHQRQNIYGAVFTSLSLPSISPVQRQLFDLTLPLYTFQGPAQHCTPMGAMWSAWCIARHDMPVDIFNTYTKMFQAETQEYKHQQGGLYSLMLALYMWGLLHPEQRTVQLKLLRGQLDWLREVLDYPSVIGGLERTIFALEARLDERPLEERIAQLDGRPNTPALEWHAPYKQVEGADEQALLWALLDDDTRFMHIVCEDWLLWAYAPMMLDRPAHALFPEAPRALAQRDQEARVDAQLRGRAQRRHNDAQHKMRASKHAQGRNEPCACGSGKKYKRCCGQDADEEG